MYVCIYVHTYMIHVFIVCTYVHIFVNVGKIWCTYVRMWVHIYTYVKLHFYFHNNQMVYVCGILQIYKDSFYVCTYVHMCILSLNWICFTDRLKLLKLKVA